MDKDRYAGDLGTRLRSARERRGVSLRDIAGRTKISVSVLEALERNDISRLPGGIFARAFVRSYAIEVGLDAEAVLQQFLAQFPHESVLVGHARSDRVEDNDALESDRRFALTLLQLVAISVPIAAALLYVGSAHDRPVPAPASPPPLESARTPSPREGADIAASVSPASAQETAEAAAETVAPAANQRSAEQLSVALTATRRCWISATVDGRVALARELLAGEEAAFDVRDALVLSTPDAAAIAVRVNGAPARPLGGDGQIVTARLDLRNYHAFVGPR